MLPSTKARWCAFLAPIAVVGLAACQPETDPLHVGAALVPGVLVRSASPIEQSNSSGMQATSNPVSASGARVGAEVPAAVSDQPILATATGPAATDQEVEAQGFDGSADAATPAVREAAGGSTPASIMPPLPIGDAVPYATFETGPMSSPIVSAAVTALGALVGRDGLTYDSTISALADAVGATTGLDARQLVTAWRAATAHRMEALLSALTQVGVAYHYAQSNPGSGFDCSGLVSWAWSVAGVGLEHQSGSIISSLPHGDISTVLPGDVLWYPGHVSLALGVADSFVDAPNTGNTIRVESHTVPNVVVGVVG